LAGRPGALPSLRLTVPIGVLGRPRPEPRLCGSSLPPASGFGAASPGSDRVARLPENYATLGLSAAARHHERPHVTPARLWLLYCQGPMGATIRTSPAHLAPLAGPFAPSFFGRRSGSPGSCTAPLGVNYLGIAGTVSTPAMEHRYWRDGASVNSGTASSSTAPHGCTVATVEPRPNLRELDLELGDGLHGRRIDRALLGTAVAADCLLAVAERGLARHALERLDRKPHQA
jgi:hypothetical protein